MKYLLLRNQIELKKHILKFYTIQIMLLLSYLIINNSSIQYFELREYTSILGLNSINDLYIMFVLIKITSYLVIIHLIIKIFVESILKNIQYIMLRLNNKKWILYEIINFAFYVILMRIIYNSLLYIMLLVFKSNITFAIYITIMFKDMFFSINIMLFTILILNIFSYKKYKKFFVIVPLSMIIISLFVDIIDFSIVIQFMIGIILIILNLVLFSPSKFYTKYCNK